MSTAESPGEHGEMTMNLGAAITKTSYTNLITEGCDTYNQDITTEQSAKWAEFAKAEDAKREVAKAELIKLIGQERADRTIKHFGGDAVRGLALAKSQIASGKCKAI
jgi:hypothetical protein